MEVLKTLGWPSVKVCIWEQESTKYPCWALLLAYQFVSCTITLLFEQNIIVETFVLQAYGLIFDMFLYYQNIGPHFETWNAGVLGPVTLSGLNQGKRDLTWQKWSYKVCVSQHSMQNYLISCIHFLLSGPVCVSLGRLVWKENLWAFIRSVVALLLNGFKVPTSLKGSHWHGTRWDVFGICNSVESSVTDYVRYLAN